MFKKLYTLLAIGLLFSACSEDTMDRINKNVNDPKIVPSRFTITDAITSSAFNVTGSDLFLYASSYIEHNVGIYGQLYNAEARLNEPFASSTYDNTWTQIYANLYALKGVIAKCSAGGAEEGNYQALGIAQILTGYNLAVLTDVFGDVPWSEAIQPGVIYQPKLDKQQDIYNSVFKLLNDGIANLNKTTPGTFSISSQDLIYSGSNSKWIKAANGLIARYTMRLSLRNANYDGVITAANASFTTVADEFKFAKYDGSIATNPAYMYFVDRDYVGASQSVHDKLVARNDPRDAYFFAKYPGATNLTFAPNGSPIQKQASYGVNAFQYRATKAGKDEISLVNQKRPTYIIGRHELLFLKAEAYARKTPQDLANAEVNLKAAISAAFVKDGLTSAQADTYYTDNVKVLFDANPLKEIAIQKYLSFYQNESLEAYNDYRRLAAQGTIIPLSNTKSFPQRFTYGSSDVTANPNIKAAYGDGQYVKTEKVWWAGGTR